MSASRTARWGQGAGEEQGDRDAGIWKASGPGASHVCSLAPASGASVLPLPDPLTASSSVAVTPGACPGYLRDLHEDFRQLEVGASFATFKSFRPSE